MIGSRSASRCGARHKRESVSCHGRIAAVRPKEVVAMSASVRAPADDRNIELGTGMNWPPIVAAVSLGLVVLTAAVVVGLLAAPAAPQNDPAPTPQTIAHEPEKEILLPAPPDPPPQPKVVAATAKPAWPHKPKLSSKPFVVATTPCPTP